MGYPVGLIRLIRPINCIMIGFAVLVGALIGGGAAVLTLHIDLFLAFLTGSTLAGSAMAINDYYDREIDAINEPGRPIPSGAITPKGALAASLVLSAIGLVASWMTGIPNMILALLAWTAAILYATVGKGTGFPGNLLVSSCVALPFVYGGVMTRARALGVPLFFTLMAFLTNTGREVTKGIVDIKGDRVQGIRTIAVSKGAKFAAWVSAFFYISAVFISFIPYYRGLVSLWYMPFVAFTDLGLLYFSVSLIRSPSRENSRKVKNKILLLMMSGMIGFLFGSLL